MSEYNGRIIGLVGGLYTVLCDTPTPAGQQISCRARGVFRYKNEKPLVGDRVTIELEQNEDFTSATINKIHARKNALLRPPIANLDYIFITLASASPAPDPKTVDQLTAVAEINKIEPVIIIAKSELNPDRATELKSIYQLTGYNVFSLSCYTGEGVDALSRFIRQKLPGRTAAFAGASGVGKSTLMNLLFPGLELQTAGLSRKTERGRHTTRQVTIYPILQELDCAPGYLADTPGFSLLDFERFDYFSKEDLPEAFREFAPYLGACRYTRCSHTKEEGCAIIEAIRQGNIAKSRHESYINLYTILKTKHPWDT